MIKYQVAKCIRNISKKTSGLVPICTTYLRAESVWCLTMVITTISCREGFWHPSCSTSSSRESWCSWAVLPAIGRIMDMGSLLHKELYSHTCWKNCLLKSQSDQTMFSVMNKDCNNLQALHGDMKRRKSRYYSLFPIKRWNKSIEAPAWAVQAKVLLAALWGSCVTKLGLHLIKYFITEKISVWTLVYKTTCRNITEFTWLLSCQATSFWIVFIFTYEYLPWCILKLYIDIYINTTPIYGNKWSLFWGFLEAVGIC